ncbi:hypothetical protein C8250_040605 [Streptomyces sp. So13.3]|uniref:acetate--CoA ligase family protein n=1 Tax=Streptomyces TaxID=1883 RepID=UPI00110756E1|nr:MULTISPECIES: acetate--CoA ligase family protein [Streptomyces]QNA77292.1 hypothetical protein C8250_040605 [Streptomyces sp. So13.3]
MLHSQPLPPGTNVAVVSNSRGAGIMAADACRIACDPLAEPATRPAPLTERDARALLADPRCSSLLPGRHGGSADIGGVKTLLLRLSRMAEDLPQLAEAAIDTVVAGPSGVTARDARIRLLPRRVHDPYLRRLR